MPDLYSDSGERPIEPADYRPLFDGFLVLDEEDES